MRRRRCLHLWRRRQGWWSRTNNDTVYACSPCRQRWAAEKKAKAERHA